MTVFASGGKARTFDYQAGDVGYVPFAMGHYVENTGDETLRFLEMFRSDHFADVSLNQWMALTPPELVQAHLNIDEGTVRRCPRTSRSSSAARRERGRSPSPCRTGRPRRSRCSARWTRRRTRFP